MFNEIKLFFISICIIILTSQTTLALSDDFSETSVNKNILLNCVKNQKSPSTNYGCLDALSSIQASCEKKKNQITTKPLKKNQRQQPIETCKIYEEFAKKSYDLFDIDAKSCVVGFETIFDRLLSLKKYNKLLNNEISADYEKLSCRQFRKYVNVCVYADGNITTALPRNYSEMPALNLNSKSDSLCSPKNTSSMGLYLLTKDIQKLSETPDKSIYEKLITDYRRKNKLQKKRSPASDEDVSGMCNSIRNTYAHVGCDRFEKFSDPDVIELYSSVEDEIKYNELHLKKLQMQQEIRYRQNHPDENPNGSSGGSAN